MAEATDKTSSLQEIITCSICLEVLNKPVIFPCIHHFCKTCKEQLKKETQGGVTGILCPLCQQFASDEAIKEDFVMEQIINVHTKNSGRENAEVYCDFCTKEKSSHKCLECKSTLCENCKTAHTRIPACKGHTIKPIDETEEAVIDSVVFCSIHTDKIIEFNCEDCNKALCYRCKILHHDGHRTQSIEDAIASILPIVQKKMEPIQKDITFLNQCITSLNDMEAATIHKQEQFKLDIENKQVQLQKKMEFDSTSLDTEVKKTFQAKIKEIKIQRCDLGHMLSSKESIKSRADTLLNHLKDVNLLLQLQVGLR